MTATAPLPREDWIYRDNGFTSMKGMQHAHARLIDFCAVELESFKPFTTLLDLGCGNGLLTLQLKKRLMAGRACGLDLNADVIARANILCDTSSDTFIEAAIADAGDVFRETAFDLVVIMAGRIIEAKRFPDQSDKLQAFLSTKARFILLYLYDDWFRESGPLTHCPLNETPRSFRVHSSGTMAMIHL